MSIICPECGQTNLIFSDGALEHEPVWDCPNCKTTFNTNELEDLSSQSVDDETTFQVPFTQIVKIENIAYVKAKTPEEAMKKAHNGIWEEIDESDSEIIATDINLEDISEEDTEEFE